MSDGDPRVPRITYVLVPGSAFTALMGVLSFAGGQLLTLSATHSDQKAGRRNDWMMMEGVRLMAVGMFTVFAFLTLLVGLMKASAAFFEANAHRFPEDESETAQSTRADDADLALAIALAHTMRLRSDQGQEQKV